jgi:NAD(P)H dehydrogenase (quinone)
MLFCMCIFRLGVKTPLERGRLIYATYPCSYLLFAPFVRKIIKRFTHCFYDNPEGKDMKTTVILAHPYRKSFNHAIFQTVCSTLKSLKIEVFSHDLYEEHFNPLLSIEELDSGTTNDNLVNQYIKELVDSDFLFFIHPNWWGQPPAILKGYFDRVIRQPEAFDFLPGDSGGGIPVGKLGGKYGVVFNTSNTGAQREEEYFGDPLDKIWRQCVFGFCGIEKYYRKTFSIIIDSDPTLRQQWLREVEETVKGIVGNPI